MAGLTGSSISSTYDRLLVINNGGGGAGATRVPITDGDGTTTFSLKLSESDISIENGDKFFFDGGTDTYIYESGDDVLDIYVGGANLLKFTQGVASGSEPDRVQIPNGVELLIGNADTHFIETPDDTLQLTVGSQAMMLWDQDHADTVGGMGIISCGVDNTGVDFKVYGDTSNQYMLWDQSEDSLRVAGSAAFSGPSATFITMSSGDTSPDVSQGNIFKSHTDGVTIQEFDGGACGQIITIISGGATVYDVTSSELKGGTTNITTAAGDVTMWVCESPTVWHLLSWMDLSIDLSSGGF